MDSIQNYEEKKKLNGKILDLTTSVYLNFFHEQ